MQGSVRGSTPHDPGRQRLADSMAEARRNMEAFTYERFRMASGGGEQSVLDHRSIALRPSATTNVLNPPLVNRRTDEELSDSEEEDGDDSSSQDTEPGPEQGEEDDHEWYYRRRREIEEEDATRGLPIEIYRRLLPVPEIGWLREQMEQLEKDMENAKIDEGTYIERADEIRDAYRDAQHLF